VFSITRTDGKALTLQTPVKAPADPGYAPFIYSGQLIDVKYLDENIAAAYPRAISIEILSGPHTGWHGSVNADWTGPWVGIPLGIVGALTLVGLATRQRRPANENLPQGTRDSGPTTLNL
jgi:hypothetical protein